jgi:glycosyltransferase domain-containing protein
MSDKFTLIIPTRNRHNYLQRGIDYYGNTDLNVIIADSSEVKYPKEINSKNIKYIHFGGDIFSTKLKAVLDTITTPFCGMCADDDFILTESIAQCVRFLEASPDYSSVQGNYVSFSKLGKKIMVVPVLHGYKRQIDAESSSERINQMFSNYFHVFYAIHRTENLKEIFNSFDTAIKNLNLLELYIAFISVINGKHKVLPVFYGARELIFASTGQSSDNWIEISTKEKNRGIYDWFMNRISGKLSVKERISEGQSREICQKALAEYSSHIKPPSLKKIMIDYFVSDSKKHWLKFIKLSMKHGGINSYNLKETSGLEGYPFRDEKLKFELNKIIENVLQHKI